MSQDIEKVLRECSDRFHKVLSSQTAKQLVAREGHKMPIRMLESMQKNILTEDQEMEILARGFELCVVTLVGMGAKDVTVHNCNPREEDQ